MVSGQFSIYKNIELDDESESRVQANGLSLFHVDVS